MLRKEAAFDLSFCAAVGWEEAAEIIKKIKEEVKAATHEAFAAAERRQLEAETPQLQNGSSNP